MIWIALSRHRTPPPYKAMFRAAATVLALSTLAVPCVFAQAVTQGSEPAALAALRAAVNTELNAAKSDHRPWNYRDHDIQPGKDAVYRIVETPKGDLKRMIELNGHPLTGAPAQAELERLHDFVNDPEAQAKKKQDGAHDAAQAHELLTMLPDAFLWTVAGQNAEEILLHYKPNPAFHPPDMQARVMGVMAGELVIARDGDRIKTLRGTLTQEVRIGFGLLGRIDEGGTFDVERREIVAGHWQITETHVHIGGRALLFKTIGQQEDEVKDEFKPSTAPNLQVAEEQIAR